MRMPVLIEPALSLTIAVICWQPSRALEHVLAAIARQVPPACPVMLFLSARSSDAELAGAVPRGLERVTIVRPALPASIGEARNHIAGVAHTEFVAFLDDDCVPTPGWYDALSAAISYAPTASLLFGPRHEQGAAGVGALVRAVESRRSRKCRLSQQMVLRLDDPSRQLPFCAGGNMVVKLESAARSGGMTAPGFGGAGFEDVDLQLRLMKLHFEVLFIPSLAVLHRHPLGFWPLLKKSWMSGRGAALMKQRHGQAFVSKARWVRKRDLFAPDRMSVTSLAWAYRLRGAGGALTWLAVKPIRNLAIWVALMTTEFSLSRP